MHCKCIQYDCTGFVFCLFVCLFVCFFNKCHLYLLSYWIPQIKVDYICSLWLYWKMIASLPWIMQFCRTAISALKNKSLHSDGFLVLFILTFLSVDLCKEFQAPCHAHRCSRINWIWQKSVSSMYHNLMRLS